MKIEYDVILQNVKPSLNPDEKDSYQSLSELLIVHNIEHSRPNVATFRLTVDEHSLDKIIEFMDYCKMKFVLKRVEPEKNKDSHYDQLH